MKTRPILMSESLVRPILDGSKTQTRRIMKPQPFRDVDGLHFAHTATDTRDGCGWWTARVGERASYCMPEGKDAITADARCPFGTVGDQLWVREAFRPVGMAGRTALVEYAATPDLLVELPLDDHGQADAWRAVEKQKQGNPLRWTPSILMPRWASRITIEITDVRVQRLSDISEDDARAEGVVPLMMDRGSFMPRFEGVWGHIYGPDSWASNPWVWALTFNRVVQP
jgi:hypothetical protein